MDDSQSRRTRLLYRRGTRGSVLRRFDLVLPGVPIFNYHGLTRSLSLDIPAGAQRFWLSPMKFRSHLACIRDQSFQVVCLNDLDKHVLGTVQESPAVVLTFDDGLASDYEIAFSTLAEFGMKAVFFVNSATVGQAGYLNWTQLAEMQRAGMSIQSHGHRHVDLTVLPTPALDAELRDSKQHIEDRLGSRVAFLAAPHGLLDQRVVRRALAVGYDAICSTRCWPARPGSSIFTRITLHQDVQLEEFHGFLTGEIWPYARRLSRGLLYRPLAVASHLSGVLRYRLLKLPTAVSK